MAGGGFSIAKRLQAFWFAISGLLTAIRTQHALWIHLCAAAAVIGLGLYYNISRDDWRWLVLGIALVVMAETMNTALEFLADAVTQEQHPLIGLAKDIAAGAVLVAAFAAATLGVLTFWPYVAA
jgi:diacylglycerol kinase